MPNGAGTKSDGQKEGATSFLRKNKLWIGGAVGALIFLSCGCCGTIGAFLAVPYFSEAGKTGRVTRDAKDVLKKNGAPMDDLMLTHAEGNKYTGIGTNQGDRYNVEVLQDGNTVHVKWVKQLPQPLANDPVHKGRTLTSWAQQLENDNVFARDKAVKALGEMGPTAKDAVPALIRALKDPNQGLRAHAADSLGKIGPAAIPALIQALKDEDQNVSIGACIALSDIGNPAVPALCEALKEENVQVRRRAASALSRVEMPSEDGIQASIRALKDNDTEVRRCAVQVLINKGAPIDAPALILALQDDDLYVRRSAARCLARFGGTPGAEAAAKTAVPVLIQALQDKNNRVRESAAYSLGQFGPLAKASIPMLTKLQQGDEDPGVRTAARNALKKIEGK